MTQIRREAREFVRSELAWTQDFLMMNFHMKAHEAKRIIREMLESV